MGPSRRFLKPSPGGWPWWTSSPMRTCPVERHAETLGRTSASCWQTAIRRLHQPSTSPISNRWARSVSPDQPGVHTGRSRCPDASVRDRRRITAKKDGQKNQNLHPLPLPSRASALPAPAWPRASSFSRGPGGCGHCRAISAFANLAALRAKLAPASGSMTQFPIRSRPFRPPPAASVGRWNASVIVVGLEGAPADEMAHPFTAAPSRPGSPMPGSKRCTSRRIDNPRPAADGAGLEKDRRLLGELGGTLRVVQGRRPCFRADPGRPQGPGACQLVIGSRRRSHWSRLLDPGPRWADQVLRAAGGPWPVQVVNVGRPDKTSEEWRRPKK